MLRFRCSKCGLISKIIIQRSKGFRNTEIIGLDPEDAELGDLVEYGEEKEFHTEIHCICGHCHSTIPELANLPNGLEDECVIAFLKARGVKAKSPKS